MCLETKFQPFRLRNDKDIHCPKTMSCPENDVHDCTLGSKKCLSIIVIPKKISKIFLLKLPETWNKLKKFWPSPKHLEYFCIFTYTFVARNDARKVSHTHFLMSANFDISTPPQIVQYVPRRVVIHNITMKPTMKKTRLSFPLK